MLERVEAQIQNLVIRAQAQRLLPFDLHRPDLLDKGLFASAQKQFSGSDAIRPKDVSVNIEEDRTSFEGARIKGVSFIAESAKDLDKSLIALLRNPNIDVRHRPEAYIFIRVVQEIHALKNHHVNPCLIRLKKNFLERTHKP